MNFPDHVVGLFPGQGAYVPGLLKQQWTEGVPEVAEVYSVVDAVAERRLGSTATAVVFAQDPPSLETLLREEPEYLQLAIMSTSVIAFRRARGSGTDFSVLLGHSLGEIAALVSAGVWSIEDGASIVCDRVGALREHAPQGGLLALACPARSARKIVDLFEDGVLALAVDNSTTQCVVSGPAESLHRIRGIADLLGIAATPVASPYGFHHPALAGAARELAARAASYPAGRPALPVYSPILGRFYRDHDDFADLLGRHLVHPVGFRDAVAGLWDGGARIFTEVGAGRILTGLIRRDYPLAVTSGVFDEARARPTRSAPPTPAVPVPVAPAQREAAPAQQATAQQEAAPAQQATAQQEAAPAQQETAPAQDGTGVPVRAELLRQLQELYADELEYPVEVLEESSSLEGELGVDSMRQVQLLAKVRAVFDLGAPPAGFRTADYPNLSTITDFVLVKLSADDAGAGHGG
ncbi:acyl transferase domain-containing protein [Allocatelliglobosispora scoriae]|uniref:[acyl-carrier-protein] S-malonyltransferase n=1 Tax=Allocatelliglobosispora scoriae TaxID=643052 RepID=A0A841BMA7_9ACTN|nr:acyltransferase domain-containing protein [Allocatelliglobosispora scoriae]MBB5868498.1 acyl transferase domain-containing protein [Allocatelliglobosispora scoriae]